MTIDLKDFDVAGASEAGSELTILHPTTGAPTDIRVMVAGPDSKRARDADRAVTDEMTRLAQDNKLQSDDETFERLAALKAARLTMGWSGVQWNEADYPYSPDNAEKLYRERRWIREQLEKFGSQRGNFFKVSPKNLAA